MRQMGQLQPQSAAMIQLQDEEELLTPAGRVFIQPKMSCNIIAIVEFRDEIDVPSCKNVLSNTLAKHKRFSSILVGCLGSGSPSSLTAYVLCLQVDRKGRHVWRPVKVNIDDHIIVPSISEEQSSSLTCAQDYAAELALAPPLDPSKPLWEIHVLEKAGIFRIHHSLGDGTSLMSLFMASTRKVDQPDELPSLEPSRKKPRTGSNFILRSIWKLLLILWTSLLEIGRFLLIGLFLEDSRTAIKGSAGIEHSVKRIVTMEMSLDDMKTVKRAVNGTINDVLLGVVSAGVRRYLQQQESEKAIQKLRIHASALVNTRKAPGLQELADMMKGSSNARWGNRMGYMVIPIILKNCNDPLDYVRLAKKNIDRKKLSLEAQFSYVSSVLMMKIAGSKVIAYMLYRALTNTTFAISNIVGPLEQVAFCGNPITSITPTVVGQPQALCIHMQSYMGNAKLVATVATSVIPDPEKLLQYCADVLQEMKNAAAAQR